MYWYIKQQRLKKNDFFSIGFSHFSTLVTINIVVLKNEAVFALFAVFAYNFAISF